MADRDDAKHLQQAFSLHRSGRFAEAAALYRKIIRRHPREANALHSLALIEAAAGNRAEAAQLMARSLAVQPANVGFLQNYATVLCQLGEFEKAGAVCLQGLQVDRANPYLLYVAAGALRHTGRLHEALTKFDELLRIEPRHVAALTERGSLHLALGQDDAALADIERAIALELRHAEAHLTAGILEGRRGRYDQAIACFDKALKLDPKLANAWLGIGNVTADLKRHDEALAAYDRALAISPGLVEAWLGRGRVLVDIGHHEQGLAAYRQAGALKPAQVGAWFGAGNALRALGRHREAVAAYDQALSFAPDAAEIRVGRGSALFDLGEHDQALANYDEAIALRPDLVEAWLGRGNVMVALGRSEQALEAFAKVLLGRPEQAEAWVGQGNALFEAGRYEAALAAYDKALAFGTDLAEAWLGRGNVLVELKQSEAAMAAFDRALLLRPRSAEALVGRGNVLFERRNYEQAIAAYDQAFAVRADLAGVQANRLFARMQLCDWQDWEAERDVLVAAVRDGRDGASPFALLPVSSSAQDQLTCARSWLRKRRLGGDGAGWRGEPRRHDRIRIGYLSADFRRHPVAYLCAGLFEGHDRARFDVVGISIGPGEDSDIRRRLERAFDRFIDGGALGVDEVVARIEAEEIDILVDLNGFTENARPQILARRPAPIQVNYLGYPGTMGAGFIDYIIADPVLVPEQRQPDYAEKIACLPHCYMPHDGAGRAISDRRLVRAEFGLPESGFVFGCFNNAYKLNPALFAARMKLLAAVEGSVLWLSDNGAAASENLRREAARAGVDPARLVFAPRMPAAAEHLARHRLADLFLDTLPYNAHTTASDALWAGLPVLTEIGDTFAGRVAASLLTAIGLPELITTSELEFAERALELARRPDQLAAVREKLARHRATEPLFDTPLFIRHIERAYAEMYRRWRDGLGPDHIRVER